MSAGRGLWAACRTLLAPSRHSLPRQALLPTSFSQRQIASTTRLQKPPDIRQKDAARAAEREADGLNSHGDASALSQGNLPNVDAGHVTGDAALKEIEDMFEEATERGLLDATGIEGALTSGQEDVLYSQGRIPPASTGNPPLDQLTAIATGEEVVRSETAQDEEIQGFGHKFPLPQTPLPKESNHKRRYHPVLDQLTSLLMRDGKLSKAQRHMAMVLNFLRTSPPPILSPKYPLLPGSPPPSHLPLNPTLYFMLAIDSVAPLIKIRYIPGAAGGGHTLEVPVPLAVRQRRRTAFMWILDVVDKKPSRGSGKTDFAHRLAQEIIAVVEGRSTVWEKRQQVHKVGTSARANLGILAMGKGKGKKKGR